jgi:hypothetical protein
MANRLEPSGFAEFDRLTDLFGRTRVLLGAVLVEQDVPSGGSELLATETLPHIEDVEAGLRAWLRVGMADLSELRWLVLQAGVRPSKPADAAEARAAREEELQAGGEASRRQLDARAARLLFALAHARLVFALLPRTPGPEVRFPAGIRSYADIPVPRSPAELALRIEEIERELWRTATGRPPARGDGAFRRTYGFFDTAERLASQPFHLSG